MKQYNERPSKIANIGNDIKGAARHRFDTYETDEQRAKKESDKELSKKLADLKKSYLSRSDLNRDDLCVYECLKAVTKNKNLTFAPQASLGSNDFIKELRAHVVANRTKQNITDYNKLARLLAKIKSHYHFSEQDIQDYFKPKKINSFTENNGVTTLWYTSEELPKNINELFLSIKSIQWGNSVTDNERTFNLIRLKQAIDLLNTKLEIPFNELNIAFGARGKKGAAAHFEVVNNCINITRHNEGSLLHEIGHYIDYTFNRPALNIPYNVFNSYRTLIHSNSVTKQNASYFLKKEEIFARYFEAYVYHMLFLNQLPSYLVNINRAGIPNLCDESIAWIKASLSKLVKETN